jgi:hypothetical protein
LDDGVSSKEAEIVGLGLRCIEDRECTGTDRSALTRAALVDEEHSEFI